MAINAPAGHAPVVVLAPDKFKGSLTAVEAAEALAAGVAAAAPDAQIRSVPVADGGEGTVDAAVSAGHQRMVSEVTGPLSSATVRAGWAFRPGPEGGGEAVIELAEASGLELLVPEARNAGEATSRGTGEVMTEALNQGASRLILGLGGSACSDAGSGLLHALGMRSEDRQGSPVPDGVEHLHLIHRITVKHLDSRWLAADVLLASDVDNHLLGPRGAVTVFGPQKGVAPEDVPRYEAGIENFLNALAEAAGRQWGPQSEQHVRAMASHPGAGAAGGVGFAALAILGASRRRGIEVVLDLVDIDAALDGAALVATGEGSLDEQSLQGKAPVGVAEAARAKGVPVVAVSGRSLLSKAQAEHAGFQQVWSLSELAIDAEDSMRRARQLMNQVGKQIAHKFLGRSSRG